MPLHPLKAEWDADVRGSDPLGFPGYEPPPEETVLTGRTERYALIEGRFDVLGGSMGAAHGERVVRCLRRATDERLPAVVVTASGGARLQEGMIALVQMARTAGAMAAHANAGLLQVVVHRAPTTGGVFASYGGLGDLHVAAPGTMIGFAGPRVIEQLLEITVDETSHSAEAKHGAGHLDALVAEDGQAAWVEAALGQRMLAPPAALPAPPVEAATTPADPWAVVEAARSTNRASGWQWAAALCDSWVELRGADAAVRAGLATLGGERLVVVATDRLAGSGRPSPAGYRLARRALALADRLSLAVLTLVDTPGAEPGPDAERDGIASEIAQTLALQSTVRTPTVALCVGEGGSGGALAFAATDRLLMLRDAVFSVIGPEGAAAILGRDAAQAPEYARALRLTAQDLCELGIADALVAPTLADVRTAIADAFTTARPGDRERRHDAATRRWLS